MQVISTADQLEPFSGCAFVPTMGALHEGHLALIRCARKTGKPVVVSVFVNPTQFGPNEDFTKYPRQLERDLELAQSAGAVAVFAPDVDVMYPPGVDVTVPELPGVATQPKLEDHHRASHFAGVCQVVARLFDLVKPSAAVFGEKDYQQLLVIRALVANEAPRFSALQIVALPTVREADGLAMSSRNVYLSEVDRKRALALSRALKLAQGAASPEQAEQQMVSELTSHDLTVDYAAVRDAETLMPIANFSRPARALIAARVGSVRLIDNAAVGPTD